MLALEITKQPVRVQKLAQESLCYIFFTVLNLYNIWKYHFHFYSFSKISIVIQSSDNMVDTVNVSRQMERNKQLGVKDFYLVQLASGEVEFCGDILTYLLNDRLFICRPTYKAPLLRDGNLPDFDLGFDLL